MDDNQKQDVKQKLKGAGEFLQGVFSDGNNVPSSARIMMLVFSIFAMVVIGCMVYHMIHLHDPAQLGIWLPAFPMVVTVLTGLIVAPYTVSRGASTMSDVLTAMASARQAKKDTL